MIPIKGRVLGLAETQSAFAMIPSLLRQAAMGAMVEALELISTVARTQYLSGPYPTHLQPRTGRLRASLRRGDRDNIFEVKATGTMITGTLGSKTPYARIHEVGGVIKSSRPGGYLAIPTSLAKTSGGVVKAEFNRPLRTIPGLFLQRNRRGNLFAARSRGRGRRRVLEVLFNLVDRVKIPPRPYLSKAAEQSAPQLTAIFTRRFQMVIDRLNQTLARIRGR